MVVVGAKFFADVAGNDGGNDDAIGAVYVSENATAMALALLHDFWVLHHLAHCRFCNIRVGSKV